MALVEFKNITKSYGAGDTKQNALDDVTFEINNGEFVVVLGPSGAGKSTLLNLLGGMDKPCGGEIIIDGVHIEGFNDNRLTQYRAENIGFVFQFYNLIPTLTAYENVALIKEISDNYQNANEILKDVGLDAHKNKFPSQLSGGEQQRVSIARALAKNPKLLLCDEPTGALDSNTGITILSLLQDMSRRGKAVIIVTHNSALAEAADKVIKLKNGKIKEITVNKNPKSVSEVNW
ncbi:MAG: ABC transporter ATP-binding protein [Clostridiales bacterium]|jgi:putative ABC transport system ATP-binding protein|nr:ABC transporter ATP-binding protein [Clostridiales bacterium]